MQDARTKKKEADAQKGKQSALAKKVSSASPDTTTGQEASGKTKQEGDSASKAVAKQISQTRQTSRIGNATEDAGAKVEQKGDSAREAIPRQSASAKQASAAGFSTPTSPQSPNRSPTAPLSPNRDPTSPLSPNRATFGANWAEVPAMKSDGPSSPARHATHQAKSSAAGNDSLSSPKRVTLSADSSSIPSPQRMSHVDFSEVTFDAPAPSKRATRMAEFSEAKSDGPSSPPK